MVPPAAPGLLLEQVATVEGTELSTAAAFGDGFLVGGCRLRPPSGGSGGGCAEAHILRSMDGRTWQEAIVSNGLGWRVLGFSVTPIGLLAFGSDEPGEPPMTRALWRSTDGARWEPFAVPAPESIIFGAAFVLGERIVLTGADMAYDFAVDTEAWATTDGYTWTSGTTPMSGKVAANPGIVAVGSDCVDVCPDIHPLHVFRSIDGFEWAEDDSVLDVTEGRGALGSWGGRAVVGGAVGQPPAKIEATVWVDEPGGWRASRLPGGDGHTVSTVIDAGSRLLVVSDTFEDGSPVVWWTTDGRAWDRGRLDGLGSGYPTAWAWHERLVVVEVQTIWLAEF